jgi:hypothetical protein
MTAPQSRLQLHSAWTAGMWAGKCEAYEDVLYLIGQGDTVEQIAEQVRWSLGKDTEHRRNRKLTRIDREAKPCPCLEAEQAKATP